MTETKKTKRGGLKTWVKVVLFIIAVIIMIFILGNMKSSPTDLDLSGQPANYIPEVREPLNASLELIDIEADLDIDLDFPAGDFKL